MRYVVGCLIAIPVLVLFNLMRPPLESEVEGSFRDWYKTTSTALSSSETPLVASSLPKVKIKVRGDSGLYKTPQEYTLPTKDKDLDVEREKLSRILQLVFESQLFTMPSMGEPKDGDDYVSISVEGGERQFSITVPYDTVRENIQLQNLLKLLELFHSAPRLEATVSQP